MNLLISDSVKEKENVGKDSFTSKETYQMEGDREETRILVQETK